MKRRTINLCELDGIYGFAVLERDQFTFHEEYDEIDSSALFYDFLLRELLL